MALVELRTKAPGSEGSCGEVNEVTEVTETVSEAQECRPVRCRQQNLHMLSPFIAHPSLAFNLVTRRDPAQ